MAILKSLRALGLFAAAVAIMGSARWMTSAPKPGWRAQFATAASRIRLGDARRPTADSGLRKDARIPRSLSELRISVPQQRDTDRTGAFAFVITSKTGYPRLGLARGKNYFWRDFVDGHWRLLVIPADTLAPTHWLALRPHTHLPPQDSPRLLMLSPTSAYGSQFTIQEFVDAASCMRCDLYWCISHDTEASAQAMMELPADAITAYFRRHRIAWSGAMKP